MKNLKSVQITFMVISVIALFSFADFANAGLPCLNPLGGSFNFGTTPTSCNVKTLMSPALVTSEYAPVIFDNSKSASVERAAYMSKLYPVYRDIGKYYIHRRNPHVSLAEEEGFLAGLYTLAMQESVWSHYRVGADGIVRFMRGDSLHGYGFMQIDDRSHAVKIAGGAGADLVDNIIYGLDIYYASWLASATARCISSPTNYKDRARAAWAAYNGGPGSICRWTSSNSHDSEYLGHYNGQVWRSVVKDVLAPSLLNVTCLTEGVRPCAMGTASSAIPVRDPATNPVPGPAPGPTASPNSGQILGHALLSSQIPYRFLRACANTTCSKVPGAIRKSEKVALITSPKSGWVKVASLKDGHSGWIKTTELVEEQN